MALYETVHHTANNLQGSAEPQWRFQDAKVRLMLLVLGVLSPPQSGRVFFHQLEEETPSSFHFLNPKIYTQECSFSIYVFLMGLEIWNVVTRSHFKMVHISIILDIIQTCYLFQFYAVQTFVIHIVYTLYHCCTLLRFISQY